MTTKVQSDMVNIDGATVATVAAADKINFLDVTDSLVKEDTVQGVLDLVSAGLTIATPQATTSGTSFTFGSIPAGTKLIFVNFMGVSLDANDMLIQIGDSGGIETSAYVSTGYEVETGDESSSSSTAAFLIEIVHTNRIISGQMILTLENSSSFNWVSSHTAKSLTGQMVTGGGEKSLSAELTQVKISGGTFDAGEVSISYM